jgi:[ribosomal protein S5]-alanine N-acetyltransferase
MQQPNYHPFPTLSSNRLDFRALKMSDNNEIFRLRSDEIVLKYLEMPKAKNRKDAEDFITMIADNIAQNKSIMWGTCFKNSDTIIGTICLWNCDIPTESAELGYVLLPEFYGQGLMTEATEIVLNFAFKTLGFREIDGILHQKNIACLTILKKFGFVQDTDFECDNSDLVRYFLKK